MRLADFARVHISAGKTQVVTLLLQPKYRSAVPNDAAFWDPKVMLESGSVVVSVGGGQPDFYKGALTASVLVSGTALLDSC